MEARSGSDIEKSTTSTWSITEAATWEAVVATRSKRSVVRVASEPGTSSDPFGRANPETGRDVSKVISRYLPKRALMASSGPS
jgi:hypothetical protein